MVPAKAPLSSWPFQVVRLATRTTVAVGLPTYLLSCLSFPQKVPQNRFLTASLVILSSPSTLICALGAIEGFVRSCGTMFHYFCHRYTNQANYHWDQFCKEATTTHGLMRGVLSPMSGYSIISNEWSKQGPLSNTGRPRLLKEEYVVYRALRSFGRGIYWIYKQGIGCLQQLKTGLIFIIDQMVKVANLVWGFVKPLLITIRDGISHIINQVATGLIKVVKWILSLTQPLRNLAMKALKICVDVLKLVVWDFGFKTVVIDWICTQIIWNFGIKIVFLKMVWPPLKFVAQEIIWRIVKLGTHLISSIVRAAILLITWTTRQIYRGGGS